MVVGYLPVMTALGTGLRRLTRSGALPGQGRCPVRLGQVPPRRGGPPGLAGADQACGRYRDLVIDPVAREISVAGTPVELTRLEFDLLDVLSARPRVAFTRRRLVERVWGENWFGDDHIVDVHIVRLRRKLGDDATIHATS